MLHKVRSHHKFMWTYSTAVVRTLHRPVFYFLLFSSFSALVLATLAFYFIEGDARGLSSLDCAYFVVATMTGVGFGDIVAQTDAGKVLSILMMLGGTALYVSFTAVVAGTILELESRYRGNPKR